MTKRFTNVNEDIFQYGEWYCSAKSEHCADVIATALNMVTEENEQLKYCKMEMKHIIEEALTNERTAIGQSVLKQLLEQIQ